MRLIYTLFVLVLLSVPVFSQPSPASDHADLRFITEHSAIAAGSQTTIGLHIELEQGWHVYWRNPGDSGIPVRIRWTSEPPFETGEVTWPYPSTFREGHLVTYGYKDETLIMIPVTIPQGTRAGTLLAEARIEYLVCKEICLPGFENHTVRINVPRNNRSVLSTEASLFSAFRSKVPQPSTTQSTFTVTGNQVEMLISGDVSSWNTDQNFVFFASDENQIESSAPQHIERTQNGIYLRLTTSRYLNEALETIKGVVVFGEDDSKKAFEIVSFLKR